MNEAKIYEISRKNKWKLQKKKTIKKIQLNSKPHCTNAFYSETNEIPSFMERKTFDGIWKKFWWDMKEIWCDVKENIKECVKIGARQSR